MFNFRLFRNNQEVAVDNRLPVDVGLSQPLTDAQIRAIKLQVEDPSGQIPMQIRVPERTYSTTLHAGQTSYVWDMARFAQFSLELDNNGTTAATKFQIQGSNDGVSWCNYPGLEIIAGFKQVMPTLPSQFVMSGLGPILVGGPRVFRFGRILMSATTFFNHALVVHLNSVPFVRRLPDALSNPEACWNYTSGVTPLSVATPTVIQATQGPPFRQVLTNLMLTNVGSADTEFIIQDGGTETTYGTIAGGSILYGDVIKAGDKIDRQVLLRASGGNSLRFWMKTQASVALYLNCRGVLINA